jgi:hypothetical protein
MRLAAFMSHAERAVVGCSKLARDATRGGSFVGVELMRYWDDARRGRKGSFIHSHA